MLGAAVVNRLCLRRGDAARGAGVAGVTIGGPCVPPGRQQSCHTTADKSFGLKRLQQKYIHTDHSFGPFLGTCIPMGQKYNLIEACGLHT